MGKARAEHGPAKQQYGDGEHERSIQVFKSWCFAHNSKYRPSTILWSQAVALKFVDEGSESYCGILPRHLCTRPGGRSHTSP